jgi:hypothetical protein
LFQHPRHIFALAELGGELFEQSGALGGIVFLHDLLEQFAIWFFGVNLVDPVTLAGGAQGQREKQGNETQFHKDLIADSESYHRKPLWDTGRVNGSVIGCACLLLLAASGPREIVDEDHYRIGAGDWQMIFVPLRQRPATVSASYSVQTGSEQVRIALVSQEDFERVQNDPGRLQDDLLLAVTPRGKSGSFTHRVGHRDDYLILLDNRADKQNPANIRMRVAIDFPKVTQLSPERQFTVIAISFLTFFAVVTYSARKLLKATRG